MSKANKYPKVILVGRTNVGKSALFNRITKDIKSIVFEQSGVTRDYVSEVITWNKTPFELIDTGGYSFDKKTNDPFASLINEKISKLIGEGDILVFVCDAKNGLTQEDQRIARILHKKNRPVILVLNKSDNKNAYEENYAEFYKLGFDEFITASAEHGTGIVDLLDVITKGLPKKQYVEEEPEYGVVLLGRPNVGKSSLMNELLQKERAIVSDIAGTTRESLSERINFLSKTINLVDTAGVRKKGKVNSDELESLMVRSTFASMRDADVAILVVDASEMKLSHQELVLLSHAYENKKSLILVFNKMDLLKEEWQKDQLKFNLSKYDFLLSKFPKVNISCKDHKGLGKVLKAIEKVWERLSQTFDDDKLIEVVKDKFMSTPVYKNGIRVKLLGIRSLKAKIPTFLLYINDANLFDDSHLNFVENILRNNYDLKGCPIKFVLKVA